MQLFSFTILLLASSTATLALPTELSLARKTTNTDATTNADLTSSTAAAKPSSSSSSNPTGGNTTTSTGGGVNAALVPDFGVKTDTNPGARQAGSCDGFLAATNTVVNIPCTCPPSRAAFLAALSKNVAAGSVQGTRIQFSNDASDQSAATNRVRATAMVVTLQNLSGPGVGCPAASAPNFAIQQKTGQVSSKVFVG